MQVVPDIDDRMKELLMARKRSSHSSSQPNSTLASPSSSSHDRGDLIPPHHRLHHQLQQQLQIYPNRHRPSTEDDERQVVPTIAEAAGPQEPLPSVSSTTSVMNSIPSSNNLSSPAASTTVTSSSSSGLFNEGGRLYRFGALPPTARRDRPPSRYSYLLPSRHRPRISSRVFSSDHSLRLVPSSGGSVFRHPDSSAVATVLNATIRAVATAPSSFSSPSNPRTSSSSPVSNSSIPSIVPLTTTSSRLLSLSNPSFTTRYSSLSLNEPSPLSSLSRNPISRPPPLSMASLFSSRLPNSSGQSSSIWSQPQDASRSDAISSFTRVSDRSPTPSKSSGTRPNNDLDSLISAMREVSSFSIILMSYN